MKKTKEHLVSYFNSYLLALVSTVYGWQLVIHPEILLTYKVYQKIRDVFDYRIIGLIFMTLGIVYALATILHRKKIKKFSLPVFSFLWSFFSLSFIVSEPPNTVGVLTIGFALLSFGISLRGDFKDG